MKISLGNNEKTAGQVTVELGIFAHNEQATIAKVITDLSLQTVFNDPKLDIRVSIIANGCTDATESRATKVCANLPKKQLDQFKVISREQAGKSRTVHHFIHVLASPFADFLVFMDADIQLPQTDTLERMVAQMLSRPELQVFNSCPVKDVLYFDLKVGPITRLIAAGGDSLNDFREAICGQLFILRGTAARQVGIPAGLPVEDGFMRAMILTDLFSAPEDLARIDGDPSVFHVYESIRGLRELIRHQTRIVIGSAVNAALFARIHREALTEEDTHQLLMDASENEVWLTKVLKTELPRLPYGYIPFDLLTKRISLFRDSGSRGLKGSLMLLVGFGLDLVVYIRATAQMMLRSSAGYW